jgi:hypothetical protein
MILVQEFRITNLEFPDDIPDKTDLEYFGDIASGRQHAFSHAIWRHLRFGERFIKNW